MSSTRRGFLKEMAGAAAVVATARGGPHLPALLSGFDRFPQVGDPQLRELAAAALEAATAAGASYADVRFTLTRVESVGAEGFLWFVSDDAESGLVGVRALADGAWGFAASPVWTTDEVARLGRDAAIQAGHNARGRRRRVELGDRVPAATGEYATPIRRDPFTVSLPEKVETLLAFNEIPTRADLDVPVQASISVEHRRQQKTFASTDGTFVSQSLYTSHPAYSIRAGAGGAAVERKGDRPQPAAGGWEVLAEAPIADDVPGLLDDAVQMLRARTVSPDRYDVVLDAVVTAQILAQTIGVAAELDRVLGFEANAGGTTYLAPPDRILGYLSLGPALLNVTADRSRPGGLATVRWDDDGVAPEDYQLVKDGVVVDYQTTRELAPVLATWYARSGRAARSHGCAASEDALRFPTVQTPNLTLAPGRADVLLDDLAAELGHGLVVRGVEGSPGFGGGVTVDRQQLNGEINGNMVYEVRGGKRIGCVRNSQCLFRAPELWKSLAAVGGRRSQLTSAWIARKGQPAQQLAFSVTAAPALFRRVAVTDALRKA